MNSGIKPTAECKEIHNDVNENRLRYATFKIENNEIVVDKTGDPNKSYADFLSALKQSEDCRYGLVEYTYRKDGADRSKNLLVQWIPDTASASNKMIYKASFDGLKKEFDQVQKSIEPEDASDLEQEAVTSLLIRTLR